MRLTVLAGGLGGAKFVRGLRRAAPTADITVVANTADDIWLFDLRICPDLDTLMYYLGDGLDRQRGWGRADESFRVIEELRAYGAQPDWFGLGDLDLATHLLRSQMLRAGYPLSEVTQALCTRWEPGVRLVPMTDDRVETHVVVQRDAERVALHFQEWWVRSRAQEPAEDFVLVGIEKATPAPGVLAAITDADAVLLPPSNPVVSIGTILAVPGIAEAVRTTEAPVVGVSGIVAGRPVRGMADACLQAIGVPATAAGVAAHYGRRPDGILDGWILDERDRGELSAVESLGITTRAMNTMMGDDDAATAVAAATIELATGLARR